MKLLSLNIFLLVLLMNVSLFGQRSLLSPAEDNPNAIYKNEWSIGGRFHTNGMSAFYERVWIKDIYKKNVLQTNLFYHFDVRQQRQKSNFFVDGTQKRYVYAKQNTFFSINVLFGQRKMLAGKADKSGVSVSMVYMGGVSLGFLKPYYLEFLDQSSDGFETFVEPYTGENDSIFLDNTRSSRIVGRAGPRHGFDDVVLMPGLHGKFGFNFDFGKSETLITALEVGTQLDIFYRNVDILVTDRSRPFLLNFYISFQIGNRW